MSPDAGRIHVIIKRGQMTLPSAACLRSGIVIRATFGASPFFCTENLAASRRSRDTIRPNSADCRSSVNPASRTVAWHRKQAEKPDPEDGEPQDCASIRSSLRKSQGQTISRIIPQPAPKATAILAFPAKDMLEPGNLIRKRSVIG